MAIAFNRFRQKSFHLPQSHFDRERGIPLADPSYLIERNKLHAEYKELRSAMVDNRYLAAWRWGERLEHEVMTELTRRGATDEESKTAVRNAVGWLKGATNELTTLIARPWDWDISYPPDDKRTTEHNEFTKQSQVLAQYDGNRDALKSVLERLGELLPHNIDLQWECANNQWDPAHPEPITQAELLDLIRTANCVPPMDTPSVPSGGPPVPPAPPRVLHRSDLHHGQYVLPIVSHEHPLMVVSNILTYVVDCYWDVDGKRQFAQFKPEELRVLSAAEATATLENRPCANCGNPFSVNKHNPSKYCGEKCRPRADVIAFNPPATATEVQTDGEKRDKISDLQELLRIFKQAEKQAEIASEVVPRILAFQMGLHPLRSLLSAKSGKKADAPHAASGIEKSEGGGGDQPDSQAEGELRAVSRRDAPSEGSTPTDCVGAEKGEGEFPPTSAITQTPLSLPVDLPMPTDLAALADLVRKLLQALTALRSLQTQKLTGEQRHLLTMQQKLIIRNGRDPLWDLLTDGKGFTLSPDLACINDRMEGGLQELKDELAEGSTWMESHLHKAIKLLTALECQLPKNRGRKQEFDPAEDKALAEAWERASDAGVAKKDFCNDRKIKVKMLDNALARVRMAKLKQKN